MKFLVFSSLITSQYIMRFHYRATIVLDARQSTAQITVVHLVTWPLTESETEVEHA